MTNKETLEQKFEDELYELRRTCDHIVPVIYLGNYGVDFYGMCSNCEEQLSVQLRLNKDIITAVSILLAKITPLHFPSQECVITIHKMDHLFSNYECELFFRNKNYRREWLKDVKEKIQNIEWSDLCKHKT